MIDELFLFHCNNETNALVPSFPSHCFCTMKLFSEFNNKTFNLPSKEGFGGLRMVIRKGIDCSARKPVLVQDTEYMVEKPYHIALYFGAFGA